jgi:hypothetical protein
MAATNKSYLDAFNTPCQLAASISGGQWQLQHQQSTLSHRQLERLLMAWVSDGRPARGALPFIRKVRYHMRATHLYASDTPLPSSLHALARAVTRTGGSGGATVHDEAVNNQPLRQAPALLADSVAREVRRLLKSGDSDALPSVALLLLSWFFGLRNSEAASLEWRHITTLGERIISITRVFGKRTHAETISVGTWQHHGAIWLDVCTALSTWRAAAERTGVDTSSRSRSKVFPARLSLNALLSAITDHRSVETGRGYTGHSARRGICTQLLLLGYPTLDVQKRLRWRKLSSMLDYNDLTAKASYVARSFFPKHPRRDPWRRYRRSVA